MLSDKTARYIIVKKIVVVVHLPVTYIDLHYHFLINSIEVDNLSRSILK